MPESLTDDLWKKKNRHICTTIYCLSETMVPAARRNAFCDILHLIKMSLDDVYLIVFFMHHCTEVKDQEKYKIHEWSEKGVIISTPTSTRGYTGCPTQISIHFTEYIYYHLPIDKC